jgi:hypothetical protein
VVQVGIVEQSSLQLALLQLAHTWAAGRLGRRATVESPFAVARLEVALHTKQTINQPQEGYTAFVPFRIETFYL